ncbi:MAG TPA: helix-turn-helix domain-containing protein [Solirubrobacterales bacterium]|nr:helix-turn-helix domain-containing protein [Solirubrobacterales bacterium]
MQAASTTKRTPRRRRYSRRLPRAERREQLLDAALELIAKRGFTGVSMEAVAREADIAKTVVYDAFGNQEGLLRALLDREQHRVLMAIADAIPTVPLEGDPAEILAGAIRKVLDAIRANPETWRLILLPADGAPPEMRERINHHRERLVAQIEPMAAWGIDRLGLGHLDAELVAHMIIGTAEDAGRLTLTRPDRFPPDRLATFATDLLHAVAR